jgi:hypothetical protein
MGRTMQNQQCDSAGRKSLAKHAGQKFLTNPDALGKIGNNREGELAIGNYRDLISPDFSRFFPLILNWEKSGVIRSVESQFLESQLFCKFQPNVRFQFFAECPCLAKLPSLSLLGTTHCVNDGCSQSFTAQTGFAALTSVCLMGCILQC